MKKVLVVDDDEDILYVVKFILTSYGFDVQTHSSGLKVPEIVMSYTPDIILLDIRLPGKLGTQVCNELKQIYTTPIILFSAHTKQDHALSICHADAFIQKPFDMEQLVNTINLYLN